jgi:hypothetical protein
VPGCLDTRLRKAASSGILAALRTWRNGRRARLRIWFRKDWRFKSSRAHHHTTRRFFDEYRPRIDARTKGFFKLKTRFVPKTFEAEPASPEENSKEQYRQSNQQKPAGKFSSDPAYSNPMMTWIRSRRTARKNKELSTRPGDAEAQNDEPGWMARMIVQLRMVVASRAPLGYEDGTGFHYGTEPVSPQLLEH